MYQIISITFIANDDMIVVYISNGAQKTHVIHKKAVLRSLLDDLLIKSIVVAIQPI